MLEDLRNKYQGERLFILGTGPSLGSVDLGQLVGEYTFGLNAFMATFEPPFIPTFYGYKERLREMSLGVRQSIDLIQQHPDTCTLFVNDDKAKDTSSWIAGNIVPAPVSASSPMSSREQWWRRWARFDERGMVGHSVALDHGAQIGYWMGFNPLYLLGCEFTARPRTSDRVLAASRLAAEVACEQLGQHGIELINLSEGCTVNMRTGDWREVLDGNDSV